MGKKKDKPVARFDEASTHEQLQAALLEHRYHQRQRISAGNMVSAFERNERSLKFPKLFAKMEADVLTLRGLEKEDKKRIKKLVEKYPIWEQFFEPLRGVTTLSAGLMIGWLDPYDHSVSQLYHYAGLHVLNNCVTCGRADNIVITHKSMSMNNAYITKDGQKLCAYCRVVSNTFSEFKGRAPKNERGVQSDWNPELRSKLLGTIGPSLLKAVRHVKDSDEKVRIPHTVSKYAQLYYDEKQRLLNSIRPCGQNHKQKADEEGKKAPKINANGCTDGHMHAKSIRKMVKYLIQDYWATARTIKGLPVRASYAEEFLGRKHGTA